MKPLLTLLLLLAAGSAPLPAVDVLLDPPRDTDPPSYLVLEMDDGRRQTGLYHPDSHTLHIAYGAHTAKIVVDPRRVRNWYTGLPPADAASNTSATGAAASSAARATEPTRTAKPAPITATGLKERMARLLVVGYGMSQADADAMTLAKLYQEIGKRQDAETKNKSPEDIAIRDAIAGEINKTILGTGNNSRINSSRTSAIEKQRDDSSIEQKKYPRMNNPIASCLPIHSLDKIINHIKSTQEQIKSLHVTEKRHITARERLIGSDWEAILKEAEQYSYENMMNANSDPSTRYSPRDDLRSSTICSERRPYTFIGSIPFTITELRDGATTKNQTHRVTMPVTLPYGVIPTVTYRIELSDASGNPLATPFGQYPPIRIGKGNAYGFKKDELTPSANNNPILTETICWKSDRYKDDPGLEIEDCCRGEYQASITIAINLREMPVPTEFNGDTRKVATFKKDVLMAPGNQIRLYLELSYLKKSLLLGDRINGEPEDAVIVWKNENTLIGTTKKD